jgi:glycosyltransferase involved in cell wall biosynthesis
MESFGLTLFFTKGVSLETWASVGMLEREIAIYKVLQREIDQVQFVSYGGREDSNLKNRLAGIELIHNRWQLPIDWYVRTLGSRLGAATRQIFKSNQINGAEIALELAKKKGAKFVARCGYLLSDFEQRKHGDQSKAHREAVDLERRVYDGADAVVVTTAKMREQVIENYSIVPEIVNVIPNYVQSDRFFPVDRRDNSKLKIGFLGRLDEQKDPELFLKAVSELDCDIEIIGDGPMRDKLQEMANLAKAHISFLGNVAHNKLPKIIQGWDLFVMTSRYEGHPKALLEVMSCGVPVIATAVSGIQELLRHEVDGLLVEPQLDQVNVAVKRLLADAHLRTQLGQAARQRIVDEFSLEQIAEMELNLYKQLWEQDG